MTESQTQPRPSDRWIPWYIAGFFVLLVLTLVPMCIVAVRTSPGLVTEHAYEKGLAYNQIIDKAAEEAKLQWHSTLTVTPMDGGKVKAALVLTDDQQKPISHANVKLWFMRPTQENMDQHVSMEASENGQYQAIAALPAAGLWEARVSVMLGGQNFQISKRITLP